MKDHNLFKFHLFYFMLIGGMGCFYPYINVYLETNLHLQGSQLGLINSTALLAGLCIAPVWGIIGDTTKKYKTLLLLTILLTIVSLYFYSRQSVYLGVMIWAILFKIFTLPASSLSDTITMNYTRKHGGNYGSIRGMGSLGYCVFSVLVGFLSDLYGLDGPLFICYIAALSVALGLAFTFSNENSETDQTTKKKVRIVDLFQNKNYILILVIVILSQVAIDAAGNYCGNHLTVTLGGSTSLVSIYSLIQVLPEFLFLMIASQVVHKIGYSKYMILAFICMLIRMTVYSFTDNPYLFIAISIVHCLGVAFSSVAVLSYIQNVVDENIFGTAVAFLSVASNLGSAVFGYLFGYVYQYYSSYTIFQITAGIVLIALLLTITVFPENIPLKEN